MTDGGEPEQDSRWKRVRRRLTRARRQLVTAGWWLWRRRKGGFWLLMAAAAGLLTWLWIEAPSLYASILPEDGRAQAIALTRTGILGAGAALLTLVGVLMNLAATRESNELTRQRDAKTHERELAEQRAERFIQAVTKLDATSVGVRLGGVHALGRLAHDSPDDHPAVVEVLSGSVQTRSTEPDLRPDPATNSSPYQLATDVRATVAVLAGLPPWPDGNDERPRADLAGADLTDAASLARLNLASGNLYGVDLTGADLTQAVLRGANLEDTRLEQATLTGADLVGARLVHTILVNANLELADLSEADLSRSWANSAKFVNATLGGTILENVYLAGADLTGADLSSASLKGAVLTSAILIRTGLRGVDLSGAGGLTTQQLAVANADARTREPDGVERPASWPPYEPDGGDQGGTGA